LSISSAGDSGIDVNTSGSFERDEIDRRGRSASGRGRSRSTRTTHQSTVPLSATDDEQLEPETDSRANRDRKSRSQSPAALWQSISPSSLMRSWSRRRSASKWRGVTSENTATAGSAEQCRSKLSSLDTDSDCENRDGATRRGRRRRIYSGSLSGSGGSLTGLGLGLGPGDDHSGEMRQRRSGIFGGSRTLQRTQTTAITAGEDSSVGQSATLPRRRRCNDGQDDEHGHVPGGPSKLSSRAASWASLRRSQTSESLSLLKTQLLQLSNGFNLVTVVTFCYDNRLTVC